MTAEDYESVLRAANKSLREASTAAEVREVWKAHLGTLGHRTLGRLLIGQDVERLLERRESRAERD